MQRCPLLHDIDDAVRILKSGRLVAIPTETVYGLACRADDDNAMKQVFMAKGRPSDHPLILHVSPETNLDRWCSMNDQARSLVQVFWPGPLTVLVRRGSATSDIVTGGRETVAVRMPSHVMAQEVISRLGIPVVAPSANTFGHVSPTRAEHVIDDLGDVIAGVLDGGQCDIGVESTIVDCTVMPPQILRLGAVSREDIERVLRTPIGRLEGSARAPGMLASHYTPRCSMHLVDTAENAHELAESLRSVGLIAVVIDHPGDVLSYARRLYSDMRAAEAAKADDIVAVLPTGNGLAEAVRDRLTRAAA